MYFGSPIFVIKICKVYPSTYQSLVKFNFPFLATAGIKFSMSTSKLNRKHFVIFNIRLSMFRNTTINDNKLHKNILREAIGSSTLSISFEFCSTMRFECKRRIVFDFIIKLKSIKVNLKQKIYFNLDIESAKDHDHIKSYKHSQLNILLLFCTK